MMTSINVSDNVLDSVRALARDAVDGYIEPKFALYSIGKHMDKADTPKPQFYTMAIRPTKQFHKWTFFAFANQPIRDALYQSYMNDELYPSRTNSRRLTVGNPDTDDFRAYYDYLASQSMFDRGCSIVHSDTPMSKQMANMFLDDQLDFVASRLRRYNEYVHNRYEHAINMIDDLTTEVSRVR